MKKLLAATFGLALVGSTIVITSFVAVDPAEAGGVCYRRSWAC